MVILGAWKPFLLQLFSFSSAVFLTARIMPGIQIKSFWSSIPVALTYSFLSFLTYRIFGFLSIPFGVLTLGLGFWLINTVLLVLTDRFVSGFRVRSVFWAALASIVIVILDACISGFISAVLGTKSLHPLVGAVKV